MAGVAIVTANTCTVGHTDPAPTLHIEEVIDVGPQHCRGRVPSMKNVVAAVVVAVVPRNCPIGHCIVVVAVVAVAGGVVCRLDVGVAVHTGHNMDMHIVDAAAFAVVFVVVVAVAVKELVVG